MAMETIDLTKDPYFMRNHLGTYECKLCLTLHTNEGSYLAHTQGKKHQSNLARRQFRESKDTVIIPQKKTQLPKRKNLTIGRPGYKIVKEKDPETGEKSISIEIDYAQIDPNIKPHHRIMSAFE